MRLDHLEDDHGRTTRVPLAKAALEDGLGGPGHEVGKIFKLHPLLKEVMCPALSLSAKAKTGHRSAICQS
jgi:hypothetical protein